MNSKNDQESSLRIFLGFVPDPLRYDFIDSSPYEAHGLIAALVPKGARVLDIGCGSGVLGTLIASLDNSVHYQGVEPSAVRAEKARSKGLRCHTGYLTSELRSDLGVYDVVILADVIEHLDNPLALLDLARLYMKPDSILIVSAPNVAHWSVRLSLLFGRFDYTSTGILDATHVRWFTKASLLRCLHGAGLRVVGCRAAPGRSLSVYDSVRKLSSCLAPQLQSRIFGVISNMWPEMFACQFVVSCRLSS